MVAFSSHTLENLKENISEISSVGRTYVESVMPKCGAFGGQCNGMNCLNKGHYKNRITEGYYCYWCATALERRIDRELSAKPDYVNLFPDINLTPEIIMNRMNMRDKPMTNFDAW